MANHAKRFIAVRWQTCFSWKHKIQSNIRLPTLKTKLNQLLQWVLGSFKVWMFKNGKFLNTFLGSVSDSWWWDREEGWFSRALAQGAAGPQAPRGGQQNRDADGPTPGRGKHDRTFAASFLCHLTSAYSPSWFKI